LFFRHQVQTTRIYSSTKKHVIGLYSRRNEWVRSPELVKQLLLA
jgi:hypothetical protein